MRSLDHCANESANYLAFSAEKTSSCDKSRLSITDAALGKIDQFAKSEPPCNEQIGNRHNAGLDQSICQRRHDIGSAADLNAVPPLGVEGIEVNDDGADRGGTKTFGALGVGGLKMKIHKACIARLFERNDLVLDAETIAEVARDLKP